VFLLDACVRKAPGQGRDAALHPPPPPPPPRPAPQGFRTATNAGLPFVVVGRRVTPELVRRSLAPLVDAKRRGQALTPAAGNYHPDDRAAGAAAAGEARGADIAGEWRAGASRGWASAAAGGGGGGEE
jgi:hypothetical protein